MQKNKINLLIEEIKNRSKDLDEFILSGKNAKEEIEKTKFFLTPKIIELAYYFIKKDIHKEDYINTIKYYKTNIKHWRKYEK